MSKNIVVCCDGTNNEYGDHNSNVVLLYSTLERESPGQVALYDPGVGTFAAHPFLTTTARRVSRTLGAAFGRGITKNILDAYTFVMQNYEKGDHVFLFGFSRGAYTARAIAAMIHKVGLLQRDNQSLLRYALKMFKREKDEDIYAGFKETFSRSCPIHFLGLWDTVSSVGWIWDPVTFQFTANNPSVQVVRHAISIDERRAFFRQNRWGTRFAEKQDIKEVWFPGVHSDVGGGYPQKEGGLSKTALEWMLVEAAEHGLMIDKDKAVDVVNKPAAPNHKGKIHNSLSLWWKPAELWPKLVSVKDSKGNWHKRPRLNLGRRRFIADGACIHESALKRKADVQVYALTNLPSQYNQESRRPISSCSIIQPTHQAASR